MARFIQGDRPEAGAELAMTGWKLARLFLGVALRGTASPASLIGFIQSGPLPLGRVEIRPTYGAGKRFARSRNLLLRFNNSATRSGTDLAVSAFWRELIRTGE